MVSSSGIACLLSPSAQSFLVARFVSAGGKAPAESPGHATASHGPWITATAVGTRRRKGPAFFLGLREPIQIPTAGVVICLRTASFYCGASWQENLTRRAAPQSARSGILQGKICEADRSTTENGGRVAKKRLGGELGRDNVPAVQRQVAATQPRSPRAALHRRTTRPLPAGLQSIDSVSSQGPRRAGCQTLKLEATEVASRNNTQEAGVFSHQNPRFKGLRFSAFYEIFSLRPASS